MEPPTPHQSPEGNHVDLNFLRTIREQLEAVQYKLFADDLSRIFESWPKQACSCASDDGTHSDVEDFSYCYHTDYEDVRMFTLLEPLLSLVVEIRDRYQDLVERIEKRAATSRKKHEAKMALISQWASEMVESSSAESDSIDDRAIDCDESAELLPPLDEHTATVKETTTVVPKGPAATQLMDLPLELLGDIILLAQQVDFSMAVNFSHVSTTSRAFAVSTPMLWSTINITNYSVKRVRFHLERSLQSPLTVQWGSYFYRMRLMWGNDRLKNHTEEVMSLLVPHRHRIRWLYIAFASWEDIDTLMYNFLLNEELENLEILDIGTFAHTYLGDNALPNNGASKGWPVKELRLQGIHVHTSSRFWSSNLTNLTLGGDLLVTAPDLSRILMQTPNLRQLAFDNFIVKKTSEICNDVAPLHDLTTLKFWRISTALASLLLRLIHAPNLLSLVSMCRDRTWQDPPVQKVHPLITAASAGPQLHKLDLIQCDLNTQEWSRFLKHLPELTHLRCVGSMLEEKHLAPLRDDPISFCPKLYEIVFENELFLKSSSIRSLVEAREHTLTPIRSLTIRGWDSSNVEVEDVVALRDAVQWFTLDMFAPEVDQEKQEGGSSEDSEWSGDDEFTDTDLDSEYD